MPFRVQTLPLLVCAACLLISCDQFSDRALPGTVIPVELPCNVLHGCSAANELLAVTVVFRNEVRALQPFPVQLRVERGHEVESVSVAFSMKNMDMGLNRYQLKGDVASAWNADVTLPICVSGRTDWLADFELLVDGRRFRLQIPFQLNK